MTRKNKAKWKKVFKVMPISFLRKVWHTFKDFWHSCEDIVIGGILREVVDRYDKRKGQYVSREQVNELLQQELNKIQAGHLSNLDNLKKQIEYANETISTIKSNLKSLKDEVVNELN